MKIDYEINRKNAIFLIVISVWLVLLNPEAWGQALVSVFRFLSHLLH